MSAERVKLSEYIAHLQGIIDKYGDMDMSLRRPSDDSVVLKDWVYGDYFCGDGPYQVRTSMVTPNERRVHWKEGTYFEQEDVGKYAYFMGGD